MRRAPGNINIIHTPLFLYQYKYCPKACLYPCAIHSISLNIKVSGRQDICESASKASLCTISNPVDISISLNIKVSGRQDICESASKASLCTISNPVDISISLNIKVSGRQDLNLRPPRPKRGALPSCATSRFTHYTFSFQFIGRSLDMNLLFRA